MQFWMIVFALAIAVIPCVKFDFIGYIFRLLKLDLKDRPDGIQEKIWDALLPGTVDSGGKWIGAIERFLTVVAAWSGEYGILVAWFAFKVASKWDYWSNVVKVPDSLGEDISDIAFLKARRIIGARLYTRFLFGSGINVVLGITVGIFGNYICGLIVSPLFPGDPAGWAG